MCGMKILFISKYPPIEGGVSSQTYWLAKALGECKIEVSIVTNALAVEEEYREKFDLLNLETLKKHQPKNVFFNSLEKEAPRPLQIPIPHSPSYLSRLVNLGLKTIHERGADVIFSWYLEPYAAAGFILKKITGLPLIVRHAGSDIWRLAPSEEFKFFFKYVIQGADFFVSHPSITSMFRKGVLPEKKAVYMGHAIDDSAFSPAGEEFDFSAAGVNIPRETPVFTYLGKATDNKSLLDVIKAFSGLVQYDFRLVFISNGPMMPEIKSRIDADKDLKEKFVHMDFIPPWEVPKILRSSAALLYLENKFPIPIHSPTMPYEAVACQTPLIVSGEIFGKLKERFPLTANLFNVVEDPTDVGGLRSIIEKVFTSQEELKKNAKNIRDEFLSRNDWKGYVQKHIALFDLAAKKKFPHFEEITDFFRRL